MIRKEDLYGKKIAAKEINGEEYYAVKELLEQFKNYKTDVPKIKRIDGERYIRLKDVHPHTEFDKNVLTILTKKLL